MTSCVSCCERLQIDAERRDVPIPSSDIGSQETRAPTEKRKLSTSSAHAVSHAHLHPHRRRMIRRNKRKRVNQLTPNVKSRGYNVIAAESITGLPHISSRSAFQDRGQNSKWNLPGSAPSPDSWSHGKKSAAWRRHFNAWRHNHNFRTPGQPDKTTMINESAGVKLSPKWKPRFSTGLPSYIKKSPVLIKIRRVSADVSPSDKPVSYTHLTLPTNREV